MRFLYTIIIFFSAQLTFAADLKNEIKLYIFDCGSIEVSDKSLFSSGGEYHKNDAMTFANSCYLIKDGNKTLLWDTGNIDSLITKPEGEKRGGVFTVKVKNTLLSQLKEIGVKPEEIDFVAFSHMHADHTGNANYFPSATWLVQSVEYSAAFSKNPAEFRFDPNTYSTLANSKVIKLNGDYDVFGDGAVMIYSAPGHTPGHQVLLVKLVNTGPVLLSGDLYHFDENRAHKRVPVFNFDQEQTIAAMNRVEDLIIKEKAQMWIQHDLLQSNSRKHSPAFYA